MFDKIIPTIILYLIIAIIAILMGEEITLVGNYILLFVIHIWMKQ